MEDSISTAAPDGTAAGTPSGADAGLNGNGQPTGEATGQSATGQESFIPSGVDLKTLPPQVRAYVDEVNKQMVRGFTEKTTKLSETVKAETAKAVAAFRQKADFYDQIAQQKDFVERWNTYVKEVESKGRVDPSDPVGKLEAKLQQMEAQFQTEKSIASAEQIIKAFEEAVDEKGNKINADFEKLSKVMVGEALLPNGQKNSYSLLRASIELAPGGSPQEKLANGYKNAKAIYDSIFAEGQKAERGRTMNRARNGSFAPSSMNATSIAPHRAKNAMEALTFARKGLAVPEE